MLAEFSSIFVTDKKKTFLYNLIAALIKHKQIF